jgi:putative DNA modification/repair radical SAM protein
MSIEDRLTALAAAARFDMCGGSLRSSASSSPSHFIHRAVMPDGGCVSLFKVLMTNICINDCAYCINSSRRDIPRTSFQPGELAQLFMDYQHKHLVSGLFLSSGIAGNPDLTMERMIQTVEILRRHYQFKGYIHLKILPGASPACIEAACRLANRVSVNIEAPTAGHLSKLSSRKDIYEGILSPMRQVKKLQDQMQELVPSGQTTQFVVGAAGESDRDILNTSMALYQEIELRRIYFSAYKPVGDPGLSRVNATSPWRAYRLYQADWLLRVYKFALSEVSLALDKWGNLPLKKNPKLSIAQQQPWLFPVDINRASYDDLLRVPGIGPVAAGRIIQVRREHSISSLEQLRKLHVRYREAAPFIWFKGMLDWERQISFMPQLADERQEDPELTLSDAVGGVAHT